MGRSILALGLLVYCAFLFRLLVFKNLVIGVGQRTLTFSPSAAVPHPNLVPLSTMVSLFDGSRSALLVPIELGGNLILFVPIGVFLALLKPHVRLCGVAAVAAGLSFTIEMAQLITGLGIFDVDDILLNTSGAVVGQGLARMCLRIVQSRRESS